MIQRLFIRFKPTATVPPGFDIKMNYPVFAIHYQSGEDAKGDATDKETMFLLANKDDEMYWVEMSGLLRQPPPADNQHRWNRDPEKYQR